MAGVPAGLPAGVRLSDHICLGVIARAVPPERVRQVLAETGKASERERDLPAQLEVSDGHPGRDPPDAPSPRSSQSQATARPMTSQTGCQFRLTFQNRANPFKTPLRLSR